MPRERGIIDILCDEKTELDAELTAEINRRVPVEQYLLDVANGRKSLPGREKCRELAQKLGGNNE